MSKPDSTIMGVVPHRGTQPTTSSRAWREDNDDNDHHDHQESEYASIDFSSFHNFVGFKWVIAIDRQVSRSP